MQLKKEIEDRTHLHKNLEQLYDGRLKNIQSQLDTAVAKNIDYEKMVKYLRKKGADAKDAVVKVCINDSFVFTDSFFSYFGIFVFLAYFEYSA